MTDHLPIYGLLAEFDNPETLVRAVREAHEAGYRQMDAYTPFPIEEVAEALEFHDRRLPVIVFVGGLIGCIAGFSMQYYASVISYPINVGGKPLNSWPAFIPVTFEMTILFAALCAVIGMLRLNRLPMPYHPLFNDRRFSRATSHGFFLCIESADGKFDRETTAKFLKGLHAKGVSEVAN